MPIRMSGLISNMDTDTIIKQLVDAQKIKNKRTTDKRDLLSFKQEKWKDLNTKLLNLYKNDLDKLRFQKSYLSKKVTSSNENIISVTSNSTTTPEGSHSIEVTGLAKPQNVAGGPISKVDVNGKEVNGGTKLVNLVGANGDPAFTQTVLTVTTSKGSWEIDINPDTTVSSFTQQLNSIGLTANYDTGHGRFFISSKGGGTDSWFTITASKDVYLDQKRDIKKQIDYYNLNGEDRAKADAAIVKLRSKNPDGTPDTVIVEEASAVLEDFAKAKIERDAKNIAINNTREDAKNAIKNGQDYLGLADADGTPYRDLYDQFYTEADRIARQDPTASPADIIATRDKLIERFINNQVNSDITGADTDSPAVRGEISTKAADVVANGITLNNPDPDNPGNIITTVVPSWTQMREHLLGTNDSSTADGIIGIYAGGTLNPLGDAAGVMDNPLNYLGLSNLTLDPAAPGTGKVIAAETSIVTAESAKNSEIIYNGAPLTGDSNVINVNGLTITIKGTTIPGQSVSLNVENNSEATYDMIKNFIKNYNTVLTEMNNLYYAKSAKEYAPLSDDERSAMSDEQINRWETKIKDSILRRDDTLSGIMSSLKSVTYAVAEVGGKKYSLSSFGIQTSEDYTEKGLLHLFGDKEDTYYHDRDDKLMKAIQEDPDTVMNVFSTIGQKLYDEMGKRCSGISNIRSTLTFYNDKEMETQQTEYKKKIKILEKKLTEMEDKYYKQFSAMETALAKMQSQSNALAGMLG